MPLPFFFLPCSNQRLRDLDVDCLGRRVGVGSLENGPADHEIVGAGGDRTARRHDALLVTGRGARWADAWRNQIHLMADDLVYMSSLLRRADDPVNAKHLRLLHACLDEIGDVEAIACSMQIAIVI